MSIGILFGPDGAGKSLFQMFLIERQLVDTRRNVCTCLAVKVPEFNEYLENKYPDMSINLVERLRILSAAETVEFWKYRGPLRWDPSKEYELMEDKGENGVFYVIDEAGQNGFSAAGWAQKDSMGSHDRVATRGGRCLWYLEQHRKLNDEVIASTNGRSPHGIAKPFRDKAKFFCRLRNGYQRQMGWFKAPAKFTADWSYQEPGPNIEFFRKESFTLDLGLANCYETETGVGIRGTNADKGKRAKGIPAAMAFPIAICLGMLCITVPWVLGHAANKQVGKVVERVNGPVTAKSLVGEAVSAAAPALSVHQEKVPATVVVTSLMEYSAGGAYHLEVGLSDGSKYESPECQRISEHRIYVEGYGSLPVRTPGVRASAPILAEGKK